MPLTIQDLTIIPQAEILGTGESKQLVAHGIYAYLADGSEDADGEIKPDYENGDVSSVVGWNSSDPSVVLVNGGMITGLRAGSSMITAYYDDQIAYALVSVSNVIIPGTGIVAFAANTGYYRAAQYTTRRYRFSPTSFSVVKVLSDRYPVDVDIIYPGIRKAVSVKVISGKPQRIRPMLADCCEVRINAFVGQISAIFLASSMKEIPL